MTNLQTAVTFNWVDVVIVSVAALSMLVSLARGFVREALSLVTWIVAFLVSFKFSADLANVLISYIKTPPLRAVVAFASIFIATLIIGGLANFLLSQIVVQSGLSGTDRALGMIFGLARGILLVGVLLLFANLTTFSKGEAWHESTLVPHFSVLVDWLHEFLPDKMRKVVDTAKTEGHALLVQ